MRLEVDVGVLAAAADNLHEAVGVAREVADHSGRLTSLVGDYGTPEVAEAATEFVRQWGYGMGLVVDDAEALARMLRAGADAYRQVDAGIADAFR